MKFILLLLLLLGCDRPVDNIDPRVSEESQQKESLRESSENKL